MRFIATFLLTLIVSTPCIAGGTLRTDELASLIGQMPALRDLIHANLRLSESAFAEVRLGPQFQHLSGARLGPYRIEAVSKTGDTAFVIMLCTKARFLGPTGKDLSGMNIEDAVSIDEKLTGVTLTQAGDNREPPNC